MEPQQARRLVSQLKSGAAEIDLTPADQAMLAYAEKLTLTPQAIRASDIEQLRQHGFDDLAIHDLCCVTAYFGFVNRVADGLGVELESGWTD